MFSDNTKHKIADNGKIRILIFLVTIILIVLMFPRGESLESEVTVGSIWIRDDLIAETTFEVLKEPEEYLREQNQAAEAVLPIFVSHPEIHKTSLDSIKKFNAYLSDFLTSQDTMNFDETKNISFMKKSTYVSFWKIKKDEFRLLKKYKKSLYDIFAISRSALKRTYRRGLLNKSYEEIEKDTISVREGKFEREFPKTKYLDKNLMNSELERYIRNRFSTNDDIVSALTDYTSHFIVPDLIYSEELTREAKDAARDKVSRNTGIVNENERIVAKHNRITEDIKRKIDSYRLARGELSGFWTRFSQTVGKFLHIFIIISLLSIYIYLFRKRIYHDNFKILLIAIVILLISSFAFVLGQLNVSSPIHLLVFVPVASMLLTVIFDSRIGFYGTIVTALIAGGLRGNDYVFAVMHIIAGALAAFTVRDIKNRNQIFRSFFFIFIGYAIGIIAFGLERFASVQQMLIDGAFAGSNALISPILAYGLIIFFERAFRITTDLTLLELSDFNNPALKELARKAPGTFTHSMTIGSMVEGAAEEINANPLLARVGAYYHDIGKSLEPECFVENQMNNENIHENLTPKKSAELIIDHVKKGIELAREYKLPSEIIDFIPMHHGTMLVSFFYKKATEKLGEDNVNIDLYRYKGPKPNSKETAMVMLADACESTVRAMTDPDPEKIENVINNLVQMRIDDAQLDESPITMKDISLIKKSYLNILISQHHKRIRYPNQDEMENESSSSN